MRRPTCFPHGATDQMAFPSRQPAVRHADTLTNVRPLSPTTLEGTDPEIDHLFLGETNHCGMPTPPDPECRVVRRREGFSSCWPRPLDFVRFQQA